MAQRNHSIRLNDTTNYQVGDLVYVDENPYQPYSIAKIISISEEKGKLDLRVSGYYRRRDMTQSSLQRVDRHTAYLPGNEHSYEWNHPRGPYTKDDIHNVRLRELITCRGDDDMSDRKVSPSMLRGKCHMSRYCPLENAFSYLRKPDMFYFSTVYETDARSVSVEGNEINVGPMYQAIIPPIDKEYTKNSSKLNVGTLLWDPKKFSVCGNENRFKKYFKLLRSLSIIGRLVDPVYSSKYGDIRQVAAMVSRDSTVEYALIFLRENNYSIDECVKKLVDNFESGNHTIVQDNLDLWIDTDVELFQKNIMICHKDFVTLQKKHLPWKSVLDLVEFYYLWKTTTGYDRQKMKQDAKILSLYIRNSLNINPLYTVPHQKLLTMAQESTRNTHFTFCISCKVDKCNYWYPWLPTVANVSKSTKFYLCPECWTYWKKYGGLKRPDPLDRSCTEEATLKCKLCNKFFQRIDRFNAHISHNHPHKCTINPCSLYYNSKEELDNHNIYTHFVGLTIPKPSREILNKKKFYYFADQQWSTIRSKIFKVNRQMCMIWVEPFWDDLQKMLVGGYGVRRQTKFYHSLTERKPTALVNKISSTPNTLLESALEHRYVKKFNIHWDGNKIESSTSLNYQTVLTNSHAVLTTNIHYSMYSSNNLSKQNSDSSSTDTYNENQ